MGSLLNAKVTNRTGGNLPGSAGIVSCYSTSAADVGALKIVYKTGGSWRADYESIMLAGLSTVTGLTSVDLNSPWLAIYNAGAAPTGDIYILINGVIVGVIFGTAGGFANWCASTFYEVALATAQDATISGANRLTDPASGIGSFSRATWWPGADNAVAIPGTDLASTHYIGYCVRLTWPGGCPKPPTPGQIVCDIDLIGDPSGTADSDIKYYPGASGNPTDDTSAVGGAISTGSQIAEGTAGTLIAGITAAATDKSYRGIAYRKNEAA